jgi:hypothetical protein
MPLQAASSAAFQRKVWTGLIDVHPVGHLSLGDITEKPTKCISHRTSYQLFRKMFLFKSDQMCGCSTTVIQLISVAHSEHLSCAKAVVGFVGGPNVWPILSPELTSPWPVETHEEVASIRNNRDGIWNVTRYFKTVVCAHRMQAILNTCNRLLMHVSFNTCYI